MVQRGTRPSFCFAWIVAKRFIFIACRSRGSSRWMLIPVPRGDVQIASCARCVGRASNGRKGRCCSARAVIKGIICRAWTPLWRLRPRILGIAGVVSIAGCVKERRRAVEGSGVVILWCVMTVGDSRRRMQRCGCVVRSAYRSPFMIRRQ